MQVRAARSGKPAPLQDSALCPCRAARLSRESFQPRRVAEACCPLLWGHHCSWLSTALMSVPDAAQPSCLSPTLPNRAHPSCSCLSDAAQLHELAVVNITWLLVKACEHSFQLEIEPFLWEGSVLTTGRPASCIARNRLLEAGMSFGWSTGAMESQPQSAKRTPRAANRNFFW
jgi:hypothetical protein